MGLLSRLLGFASKEECSGAGLVDPEPFAVPPTRDAAAWLRALPVLFSPGTYVYFEGTMEDRVRAWLRAKAIPPPLKIGLGTIWPKPDWYHLRLEPARLAEVADLIEREGLPLCFHAHVHDGKQVLLEWHDAFDRDPMYVASSIARERVDAFAQVLHVGPVTRTSLSS